MLEKWKPQTVVSSVATREVELSPSFLLMSWNVSDQVKDSTGHVSQCSHDYFLRSI